MSEVWLLSSLLLEVLTGHKRCVFCLLGFSVRPIFGSLSSKQTRHTPALSGFYSSSQCFCCWRDCCVTAAEPHVALSFWLQLLSVLLCSVWLSCRLAFCRPSCCSLTCRRLDLTGRTSTTSRHRRCKQQYQDLHGHPKATISSAQFIKGTGGREKREKRCGAKHCMCQLCKVDQEVVMSACWLLTLIWLKYPNSCWMSLHHCSLWECWHAGGGISAVLPPHGLYSETTY